MRNEKRIGKTNEGRKISGRTFAPRVKRLKNNRKGSETVRVQSKRKTNKRLNHIKELKKQLKEMNEENDA